MKSKNTTHGCGSDSWAVEISWAIKSDTSNTSPRFCWACVHYSTETKVISLDLAIMMAWAEPANPGECVIETSFL